MRLFDIIDWCPPNSPCCHHVAEWAAFYGSLYDRVNDFAPGPDPLLVVVFEMTTWKLASVSPAQGISLCPAHYHLAFEF